MIKIHNGSPVPRYQVIVLADGNFVVQWMETSVQDLLTGQSREYKLSDFGHRVTDAELESLRNSGVVEDFDQAYVWIYALPEDQRFGAVRTLQEPMVRRMRSYYINTTLPADKLADLNIHFETLDLAGSFCACEHERLIAVMCKDAIPFTSLKDAEDAQRKLQAQLPELLGNAAIAFTENEDDLGSTSGNDEEELIDLDALIASQTDTSVTHGKQAVVACKDDYERHTIMRLLKSMEMAVVGVDTAQKALNLLEEGRIDLLVMDVRLDDMHGWAMLGKAREIGHTDQTCVIVLADAGAGDQIFALTVANVDVYLIKPISMARLRQSVWSTLKEQAAASI